GVQAIGLWGVNPKGSGEAPGEEDYSRQRAAIEYLLGVARQRGIEVVVPPGTSLRVPNRPRFVATPVLYAYDWRSPEAWWPARGRVQWRLRRVTRPAAAPRPAIRVCNAAPRRRQGAALAAHPLSTPGRPPDDQHICGLGPVGATLAFRQALRGSRGGAAGNGRAPDPAPWTSSTRPGKTRPGRHKRCGTWTGSRPGWPRKPVRASSTTGRTSMAWDICAPPCYLAGAPRLTRSPLGRGHRPLPLRRRAGHPALRCVGAGGARASTSGKCSRPQPTRRPPAVSDRPGKCWALSTGPAGPCLELSPLLELHWKQLLPLGHEGLGHVADVAHQSPQPVGFQRCRVVGPFPRPVQGEMALD